MQKFAKLSVRIACAALVLTGLSREFAISAVWAQGSPQEQQIAAHVATARQHVTAGAWDLAIAECDKGLAINGESPFPYLVRGQALAGKQDFEAAIKDFTKVTTLPHLPGDAGRELKAEAFTLRSAAQYEVGKFLPAIDSGYYAQLEKYDYIPAIYRRCLAYVARGQYDKAINKANEGIYLSKEKSAEVFSARGLAYSGQGNHDQGIADQTKALSIKAAFPEALYRRAEAYAKKGEGAKSLTDLDQAITAKPDFWDALCDRAYLYGLKREGEKAKSEIDSLLSKNPKFARGHVQRGMMLLDQKNFDQAMTSFDEAVKLKPSLAEAYCYRGYAWFGKKDNEKAIQDFTKAIELNSKLVPAYQGRQQVYSKMNRGKDAKADQLKLAELQPQSSKKPAEKKKEEEPPKFVASSKEVNPAKRKEAQASAKEIDRLIEANYKKHNVTPNPRTTDEQFLRRVYLDITGTIPTYQQARRFQTNHEANKRADLIDELLNSEGYASHFFNYWADVLRYTDNLNNDVRGEGFRQWIKQSLAENKPWDKMVTEMLTAEGRIFENPATGYLQRDPGMPLDLMNNTVRIFAGTRIGCAQCHNHPFDRWTQKEFYQTAAFMFGTQQRTHGGDKRFWKSNPSDRLAEQFENIEQEEEDRRNRRYTFDRVVNINMTMVNDDVNRKIALPHDYAYTDAKPHEVVEPRTLFGPPSTMKAGETPRQAFARWLTAKENPRFALTIANRLWKQAFGAGQIEPVDDMTDDTTAENPALMEHLVAEMKRLNFDMKEYLRILFNSETYQRQASPEEAPLGLPYHFAGPILRRMTAEQVWDSFLTLAVIDPWEYRELPATVRSRAIGVDLATITAEELLDAERKANEVDYNLQAKRREKYHYKGTFLARASELPSPVPPNHFLRTFGQSDREQISSSSTQGSVPQVLFMFNGPVTHMLLEPKTTIYNNVTKKKNVVDAVRVIFETVLSRAPDEDEINLAKEEIKRNGNAGYGNVIWALVNTREFLFVQ